MTNFYKVLLILISIYLLVNAFTDILPPDSIVKKIFSIIVVIAALILVFAISKRDVRHE